MLSHAAWGVASITCTDWAKKNESSIWTCARVRVVDRSKRRSLRCPAFILERSQVFVFPCFWMKDKSDLPDGESLGKRKRKKHLMPVFFMRENVEGIGCCCFSNERWSDYANVLLPKISYRRVQNLFLLLLVCWFESQSDVLVIWKLCPGKGVKQFRKEGRG